MKNFVIAVIRFYQRHISSHLPAQCRFYPTCSAYAIEALRLHGFVKGGLLALWRILRCNPLSAGGYDPVPTPKRKKTFAPENGEENHGAEEEEQ